MRTNWLKITKGLVEELWFALAMARIQLTNAPVGSGVSDLDCKLKISQEEARKVQGLETELAEVRREVTQIYSRLDALFDLIRTRNFDDTSSDCSLERENRL